MRILHVSDVYLPRTGGIELHVRDLAARQHAAGHAVEIVTGTPGSDVDSPAIPVHRPTGRFDRYRPWRTVLPLLDAGRFDLVHAHISAISPLAYVAIHTAGQARPVPIPTAVTVHSLWRGYTGIYRAADLLVGASRWPLAWSAVSHAAEHSLQRAARRPIEVDVVPNGIDPARWSNPVDLRSATQVRVASVMRFTHRKRPLALLRMLRQVREQLPSTVALRAVLIGDGPARARMQRYVDHHALKWIEMPGWLERDEIANELSRSDVYAAPARLESFGIAALEAHLIGLPVVAMRATGIADFIVDGQDGRLCDNDSEMRAALIDELLVRRRVNVPVTSASRDRVTWPAVLASLDRLYLRAAQLHRPTPTPRPSGASPSTATRRRLASDDLPLSINR